MPTYFDENVGTPTGIPAQVISSEELRNIYHRIDAVEYGTYAVRHDYVDRQELDHILRDFKASIFDELSEKILHLSAPDVALVFDNSNDDPF